MKFIVPVHTYSDYWDDSPSHAVIEINDEYKAYIKKIQTAVVEHGGYCMQVFDDHPDLKECTTTLEDMHDEVSEDQLIDWDGRPEGMVMCVAKKEVYWRGTIKHTDICLETEPISTETEEWA